MVLRLEFHTDIADPLEYGCRLLRKAYRRNLKVVVCGDPERLGRLDTLLWTFEQLEFIPHVRLRSGERPDAALRRYTPIWLVDAAGEWPEADVVVNLGEQPVTDPGRFARIVELVGSQAAERQAGRARWRHYVAQGLVPAMANANDDAATTP